MSDEREERCEECRFWHSEHDDKGVCRRYPPVVAATKRQQEIGETFEGWFPVTEDWQWCGEFQRIPLPLAKKIDEREGGG